MNRADRGAAIHAARERARLTQSHTAEAVGISLRTLGRIEAGQGGSAHVLADLEYYLRLRDDAPAGYTGHAPITPPEPPAPAPALALTELSRYTSAQLLAELLRRETHKEAS